MVTLVNRAKVATASTGTGSPITLGAAVDGYQTFADAGVTDGQTVRYVIEDGSNWEIGTGIYTASGTTLSRTVVESSNADAAINLSGTATVFVTAASVDIQQPPAEGAFVDGDKTKLDGIEAGADVTDTANVTAAGALMDSEVTNLAAVKAFDPADYATAAQGALADTATQPGDNISTLTNDAGYTTNTGTVTSVAATNGTGISISGSPITSSGTLTITNTAPDQTVTLTGGGATSISGTYPNFTISSTDTNTTYSAGNGITLTGTTFSVAAGGGLTQDAGGLSHSDTSAQASVDNSNGVVIQDVTLDTYGHVTGLASVDLDTRYYTETEIDSKLTNGTVTKINSNWSNQTGNLSGYVNDGGGNLGFRFNATPGATNTLVENGIAYRFDVSNDSTTGDLGIFRGSTASGTAGETITWSEAFAIDGATNVLRGFGFTIWTAGNDGAGSGLDADTVDGLQASQFLRSDTSDSMSGTLTATAFVGDGSGLTNLPAPSGVMSSTNPVVTSGTITEDVYTIIYTSGPLEPDNGSIQLHTLGSNTTYTDGFSAGQAITLMIDDGNSSTITWPTMTWVNNGGVAPTLATTGYTVVALWKVGSTLYGALVGDGS